MLSSADMTGLLVVVISLLGICHISVAWKNDWDQPLNFECPNYQHIQWFKSRHDNYYEDRQFDMSCRSGYVGIDCSWTGYLNDWDGVLSFVCPQNGIVTGFQSYHDNYREDRRWKLRCCNLVTKPGLSCHWTGYLANWDKQIDYLFPAGQAMVGMYSKHDNRREDRLFQFRVCSFAVCKATGMKILDKLKPKHTGTRVVGIATTQGCSKGHLFRLNLGGTDSVEETSSFTTSSEKSFTFETTLSVTTETSFEFLGMGGSVSFGASQSFGGSTTWGSSYEKATSVGRESTTETEVAFTGPGAALIMADVREYSINSKSVNVEYDVRCDDGARYKEKGVVNFSLKTYGITHFSSYTGTYNPGRCSRSTNECIRQLDGKKALNPYSIVADFKECFHKVGSVNK
ncbi:uncharacterized protein LOC141904498 [Tubulanus polymorphus]|uniref:uncharacterized protein LOC141904498 n=1 Tax=Tubulanus polymorphus TaxID=672921 RepID=UPI003DA5A7BC